MNEQKILELEKEIREIKERNKKVEADKAWETSLIRKIMVAMITYVLIGFYMLYLNVSKPWLNAFVPTLGFLLSTLTLGWAKELWVNRKAKLEDQ